MAVFRNGAREKADKIAAAVGGFAFLAGIVAMAIGGMSAPSDAPIPVSTTVASTPVPGDPVTMTTQSTEPPTRATLPPRVTQEVTTTEGTGPGTVIVTTSSIPAAEPFLGSKVATVVVQLILITFASLLLAFATHRVLLGEYGLGRVAPAGGVAVPPIDEDEAGAVKEDVLAAAEAADLSRPLFERGGVSDTRLRLLQNRIALELEVRKLAQNHDLPSGLTIAYVVRGLVEKKKMSERLASAVTSLSSIGDRLSHGAHLTPDATTLLTDSYAQALAKVGGKMRKL